MGYILIIVMSLIVALVGVKFILIERRFSFMMLGGVFLTALGLFCGFVSMLSL